MSTEIQSKEGAVSIARRNILVRGVQSTAIMSGLATVATFSQNGPAAAATPKPADPTSGKAPQKPSTTTPPKPAPAPSPGTPPPPPPRVTPPPASK